MRRMPVLATHALLVLSCLATPALAAEVQSVSRIAFGPADTVFVADWKGSALHALTLADPRAKAGQPFNLLDLDAALDRVVGKGARKVEDMAVRPGTGEAYIALSLGAQKQAAIVVVDAKGEARRLDLGGASTTYRIEDAPAADRMFWGDLPERSFTVTDMTWHDGELLVAGLSNQDFASTLRRIPYPFTGKASAASVEIFHASHNQMETRAPIRAMTVATVNGAPSLVAAYTCTPLVVIALNALKDGAHVRGKTIAELGYGNTPSDLLSYRSGEGDKAADYLLLINDNRSANAIPLASVEQAARKPGMSTQVPFGAIEGVQSMQVPMSGAIRTDSQDANFLLALRRNLDSGATELVSVSKQGYFRLSDFVSEYNFPEYQYIGDFQRKNIKPIQDQLMQAEGFASEIKP